MPHKQYDPMHLMFAAVGSKAPNIGVLDEESLAELRGLLQKNLGLEMLRKHGYPPD